MKVFEVTDTKEEQAEVYVVMDGVLADFFSEWAKLMGVSNYRQIKDVNPALEKIRQTEDFWINLPMLPDAKALINLIKNKYGSYSICSSPLQGDPNSEPQKREWIAKNLSFFPPKNIHITHNKPQFAKGVNGIPNILIDDFGQQIKKWTAAGGQGIKYNSISDVQRAISNEHR